MKKMLSLLLVFLLFCTVFPAGTIMASAQETLSQGVSLDSTVLTDEPEETENNNAMDEMEQPEGDGTAEPGAALSLSQSPLIPQANPGITALASTDVTISIPAEWEPHVMAGTITLNDGDTLTIEATAGSPISAVKIQISGSVAITGPGSNIDNLYIEETSGGSPAVTIEDLHITAPAGNEAYRQYGSTIYLVGSNILTGASGQNTLSGGTIAITSESNGTLTVLGGTGVGVTNSAPLAISGSADVTIISASGYAGTSTASIRVGNGAKLTLEGGSRGISTGINATIENYGTMTVAGINGHGINAQNLTYFGTGAMTVTGNSAYSGINLTDSAGGTLTVSSGTIKVSGGATGNAVALAGSSPEIVIGSGTLELTNNDGAETHTFTMASAGNSWSVSGTGLMHTGQITDSSIDVTVPTGSTSVVTRSATATTNVCAIGGTEYAALGAALAAVQNNETITLLDNIDHSQGIKIENKIITFDVGIFNLNVTDRSDSGTSYGLWVENGAVNLLGSGDLNVTGKDVGLYAWGSTVTVTNAAATSDTSSMGTGVYAMGYTESVTSHITVKGDASGYINGVYSRGTGCSVTIAGDAVARSTDTGVDFGVGVYAESADSGPSLVLVEGDIISGGRGIYANKHDVEVEGDVVSNHTTGTIDGVTASNCVVTVGGSVTCNSPLPSSTGVHAFSGATVTVEGTINAHYFVEVGVSPLNGNTLTVQNYDQSMPDTGYYTYAVSDAQTTTRVLVKNLPAAYACEIVGGSQYATLGEALNAVQNGETKTIKLLQSITYNNGILINYNQNKKITFDLNGFTLNVVNTGGPGLLLYSGGIDYVDATANPGEFNVIGTTQGVKAWESGTIVKVTNATATALSQNNDSESYGVYARYGAEIQVAQNAQGNKYGAYSDSAGGGHGSKVVVGGNAIAENVSIANNPKTGAIATNYADIEVAGSASGGWYGVYAGSNSTAKVGGNATGGMYGAYAELRSSVEVTSSVEATENYGIGAYNLSNDSMITIGGNSKTSTSTGIGAIANEGSITINGTITASAATYVRVGSTDKSAGEYTTDAGKPGYRKYSDGTGAVWVKDTTITTYVCEIVGGSQYATLGEALAMVTDSTPTTIKLLADSIHTNSLFISNKHIIFNLNGKNLTIDTSAAMGSTALGIVNGGNVDYTGSGEFNVIGASCGVSARDTNSAATVTNVWATGPDADGVRASFGGAVTVNGNVVYSGDSDDNNDAGYGISVVGGGNSVTVRGSVIASGTGSQGICATNGTVVVDGDVTSAKRGIYCYNTADITAGGNVTAITPNSVGIDAGGASTVQISGNVTATGANSTAVYANNFGGGSGGTITIGGKVQSDYWGAHATNGGKVKIDGVLEANPYIKVGTTNKDTMDYEQTTTLAGYRTYTDNTSTVWVKETAVVALPTVITNPVTAVTSSSVSLSGNATSDGGATVDEIGYVYSAGPNPVIDGTGVTRMTLSNPGMGTFNISISGLIANTTYYVRAYAHNSAGWGYGADVSFTTLPSIPNTYSVTVNSGTGGGSYTQGTTVTITANAAPGGQRFKEWIVVSGGVTLNNPQAQSATFQMPAGIVEITATYEALPINTFPITVQNDGNGTASANVNSAAAGTPITLSSTPNGGYRFKEWQVISGGVTIASNAFTMPAASVTIKAIFEPIPAIVYIVGFDANGGSVSPATMQTGADGKLSNLPTPSQGGSYSFNGWYTAASGGTKISTSYVFTANTTVYAQWTYNNGNSGDGAGSTASSPGFTITVGSVPNTTLVTVTLTGKPDSNGLLTEVITEQMVKDAFAKAEAESKRLGHQSFGVSIGFTNGESGVKSLSVKFDDAAIKGLYSSGVEFCEVNTGVFYFSIDDTAVSELSSQAKGTVIFTATPVVKLSYAASIAIGNRPVFDFTAKDGSGKVITSYGKGTITRGIKYTVASGEKTDSLFIVKIVDGKVRWIEKSSYNNDWVIWSGDSNSVYGVGYKTPAPAFTDTTAHWAKNDIDFVASCGLITSITATTFSPNTAITRADFLMALGKLSGADVNGYKTSSFTDVPSVNPAMPYIEWAMQNQIVAGIGNNKFAPNAVITREQMAVMMVNYAKATNYTLPVSRQTVTFADDAKISSWAKDQVKAIQQTGVINGKPNNFFDPQGNATRAEASAILHRFVEMVIDEGMTRGWTQNDAGQWQYINTYGKAVTGWLIVTNTDIKYYFDKNGIMVTDKWLEIDGKWFYFYADGKMTRNATIDGHRVDEDGARK